MGSDPRRPAWWDAAARAVSGSGCVLAAVSGGSDSVGLLRFLDELARERGLGLAVAHLHHGTRGADSDADAAFVRDLAGCLGWPCVVGHWRPSRPSHFEADARSARLDWLARVASEQGAGLVALGHTRDDQAETVLHRILRGTGLRGLAGIPLRRELAPGIELVRPLLGASRADLRAYLASLGQSFREDLSNLDTSRTRSRIRHDLLPKLAAEYNPEVADALVRLALQAGEALEGRGENWREVEMEAIPDGFAVEHDSIRSLSPSDRIALLQSQWRQLGWPEREMDAARWRRLSDWVEQGGAGFDVGAGIAVRMVAGRVVLRRVVETVPIAPDPVVLPIPGRVRFGEVEIFAGQDAGQETIDLDTIEGPLMVRTPVDGDRFDPLGMGGKTQSVGDFLRCRGLSREARRRVPLVCDARGIMWVVGHRIAHRVRLTEGTVRRLKLGCG